MSIHFLEIAREFNIVIPEQTLEDKFADIFLYRFDPIVGEGDSKDGTNVNWITLTKRLTDRDLFTNWDNPSKFVGVSFGKESNYALLDIDEGSLYNSHIEMTRIESVLKQVGVNKVNWYKSSGSEGWHGYIPFKDSISTWSIACVLGRVLQKSGFEIKKGHLEIFPNLKNWGAKYNSHRLPLQSGFEYSKEELCWFLEDWNEAAQENDIELFSSHIEGARKWFKTKKYSDNKKPKVSANKTNGASSVWYNNLQSIIKEGWTEDAQTNYILGNIAALHRVFTKATSVEELATMIYETAINLSGYLQFCDHQKDILKRCFDWAKSAWKKYRPFGSCNQKAYVKKAEEDNCNLNKLKETRDKLAKALERLKVTGVKITYRVLAKEAKVSLSSVAKHKDLLQSSTVEVSNQEQPKNQAFCSPHLIVKRCRTTKTKKSSHPKVKIRVESLEIIYTQQSQPDNLTADKKPP